MSTLQSYYAAVPRIEEALNEYVRVQPRNWSIRHKLDMYNNAKVAYNESLPIIAREHAFGQIYDNLRGGWQVFRGATDGYWSVEEAFSALCAERTSIGRDSGVSLMNLARNSSESRAISASLFNLKDLKRNNWYPWMAVSKFTHFSNPSLFPIYDTAVIWKKVLYGRFRADFEKWCGNLSVPIFETDRVSPQFNLTYTLLAADIIQKSSPELMPCFGAWFRNQVIHHTDVSNVRADLETYYATAFEFIAIGAASLENR